MNKPTKEQILESIAAGMNVKEQAKHFGIGLSALMLRRKKFGISGKEGKTGRKVGSATIDYTTIDAMLKDQDKTMPDIAKEVGCSWMCVRNRWLKTHPGTKYKCLSRGTNHNRITPVNLLGAMGYNYAEELEKDFHRLHRATFPCVPWDKFRAAIHELCARGINPLAGNGRVA